MSDEHGGAAASLVTAPEGGPDVALPAAMAATLASEVRALKILIGPASLHVFEQHVGPPPYPCETRCFRLPERAGTSFQRVLDDLDGWEPDVVLYLEPGNQPLLADLDQCPYPLVAIGGDWQFTIGMVPRLAECFDWMLYDTWGAEISRAGGVENVSVGYRYGSYHPGEIERARASELPRDLDVSLVSNYQMPFNFERRRLMWAIGGELGNDYRVHFDVGVYGEPYRETILRSKIVVMNCIRREFAYRALEALAGGTLFACLDGNVEIGDFLTEGVHYVSFSRENVVERLTYYLEHPEEARQIAEAGQAYVARYAYPYPLASYAQRVLDLGLPDLRERARARLAAPPQDPWRQAMRRTREARSAGREYFTVLRLLPDEDELARPDAARVRNLRGLCYLGLSLKVKDAEKAAGLGAKARGLLRENTSQENAELTPAAAAVLAFNLAEAEWLVGGASQAALGAFQIASDQLGALEAVDPDGDWPDALQLTLTYPQFYFHGVTNGATWADFPRRYRDLLAGWCAWRLGELHTAREAHADAARCFERGLELLSLDFREAHADAVRALAAAGREREAVEVGERLLVASPLEPELWRAMLDLYAASEGPDALARARVLSQRVRGLLASLRPLASLREEFEGRSAALAERRA